MEQQEITFDMMMANTKGTVISPTYRQFKALGILRKRKGWLIELIKNGTTKERWESFIEIHKGRVNTQANIDFARKYAEAKGRIY